MNEQSANQMPEEIKQKIYALVASNLALSGWIEWLANANNKNLKTETLNVYQTETLQDHSKILLYLSKQTSYQDIHDRQIFYALPPLIWEIDCVGSFNHHKATHPFTCTVNENGTMKVTFFDHRELVIAPGNEIVDTAISTDDKLFAIISAHHAMIWNSYGQNLVSKIECPHHTLAMIVALNHQSIVLQDMANTIFACDLTEKNEHIIYHNSEWATIYPVAFDNRYIFLHTQADRQKVQITSKQDVFDLCASLHFDQMKLLSWIHKAAISGNKLNLRSNLPGILHARQAWNDLPKTIRLLLKKYIQLPAFDGCLAPFSTCAIS